MAPMGLLAWLVLLGADPGPPPAGTLRIATFNTSLHRGESGRLIADLERGDEQARQIAEVLQRVRPDMVLLNEFDQDAAGRAAELFVREYLRRPQRGHSPLSLEIAYCGDVNTGRPTGRDLDRDGRADGPGDAAGFGAHPGQYGMLVLSRFPVASSNAVRTFRRLLWRDLPGAELPELDGRPYYDADDLAVLPLSSKSHWDVPLRVGEQVLHVLASHPTPPVFDGPEDRNGRRNYDELRLWGVYLGSASAEWLVDDQGRRGGLAADAPFVVLGDLNADPEDGDSRPGAIRQLLEHPRVDASHPPTSDGARQAPPPRRPQHGPAERDTAQFASGNFRVDYVLPSRGGEIVDAGVYWPAEGTPGRELLEASDHRLVWIDWRLPATNQQPPGTNP